ncbi:MAG: SDR family NAD(P)-dependent oxidoreductase [Rubripirellula sp.]|nr:SDR family NAD(P)-dependent oxidoreductase [Rubripirellula sp.]
MSDAFQATTAVVTGSSSGIGRATAIALAKAGVERLVVHFCSNQDGASETADALRENGCEPVLVSADLSLPEGRQFLIDQAFDSLGLIQTWVNNAGADVLTGIAATLDFEAKLRCLLEVDVLGTILLSREVAERMVNQADQQSSQQPAAMVFVGWDQALQGMEGDAGQMFGPAKAAVMAFANSLAQSTGPQLRVNTIAPGWIRTSWGETTSDYWDQRAKGQALMERWGSVDDIAKAVLYAADPANTFLTAQTIQLNGGFNRRF